MPRLLLTIALLAAAAAPMGAEESQPSNTVGYIAWDCAPGAWTPFASPSPITGRVISPLLA